MSEEIFIAGFDYARGGTDLSNANKGDDFSIATIRMRGDEAQFCHSFRHTGIRAEQASCIIHEQNMKFHYWMIVGDPGGGGLFVRDELRKPLQDDGARRFPVRPIITKDDLQIAGIGDPILCLFKRGDPYIDELGLSFPSDAGIVNKAHEIMKTDLEKLNLKAPKPWPGWGKLGASFDNPDAMRRWLNRQQLSPMDKVRAEIDLTMMQLITVDRETDKEGHPTLDAKGFYSFKSKRKKDAAYSLVYCNFGAWMYRQFKAKEQKHESDKEKRQFIYAVDDINVREGLR